MGAVDPAVVCPNTNASTLTSQLARHTSPLLEAQTLHRVPLVTRLCGMQVVAVSVTLSPFLTSKRTWLPPLGFLNPFIYQNAASFQDVTSGINDDGKKGKGFTAVAGWDAATGVGTPHYDNLAKVVMINAADRSIVV